MEVYRIGGIKPTLVVRAYGNTLFVPKKRYSQDPAEPGPMFVPE